MDSHGLLTPAWLTAILWGRIIDENPVLGAGERIW